MLKINRFIMEYANYKIDVILNNNEIPENEKNEKIKAIDKAIFNRKLGYITIDECIKFLNEV